MAEKRFRSKNFTTSDKLLLLDCVSKYLEVIECNQTNKKSNDEKDSIWQEIALNYNASNIEKRDYKALKSCYHHLKMVAKKENAEFKRQKYATGGGPEPKELNAVSAKLISMLGARIEPLKNEFDSGASYHQNEMTLVGFSQEDDGSTTSTFSLTPIPSVSVEEDVFAPNDDILVPDAILSRTKSFKRSFPLKRKAPPETSRLSQVSDYVNFKKNRIEDKFKFEDELVDLKKNNVTKQDQLIDKQLLLVEKQLAVADKQLEVVELEIQIKRKQYEFEDIRLQKMSS
uniref:Regulatory protein zeste n=1 Tax=Culicoides sonorensis TaxID=179676 RepID=A0A336LTV0_CULSO